MPDAGQLTLGLPCHHQVRFLFVDPDLRQEVVSQRRSMSSMRTEHLGLSLRAKMANWIASPDDFVRHVEERLRRDHSTISVMEPESGYYILRAIGMGGIAQLLIHPGQPVKVSFIKSSPDSTHEKVAEEFAYTEASLDPIARTIADWFTERTKELVRIE